MATGKPAIRLSGNFVDTMAPVDTRIRARYKYTAKKPDIKTVDLQV